MASKYLNLKGTVKWVNGKFGGLFEPDPEYGNYQLTFFPDTESWDKIKKSGLRLQTKNDEDGDFIKFRRPSRKVIKNEQVDFGRPKIYFVEGIEGTRDIGNGSSADVSVVVYDAGPHKGHRLESVTITELVRYERSTSGAVEFKDNAEENATEQTSTEEDTPSSKAQEKQSEVPFDDGIPFGDSKPKEEVKKSASPFKRMSR